jgi:hypothetical protein
VAARRSDSPAAPSYLILWPLIPIGNSSQRPSLRRLRGHHFETRVISTSLPWLASLRRIGRRFREGRSAGASVDGTQAAIKAIRPPPQNAICAKAMSRIGRVEVWRGDVRLSMSVSAPFVWRCLSGSAVAPFPHPAHRTGRADFPHPALGQDLTPSFACDAIGSF